MSLEVVSQDDFNDLQNKVSDIKDNLNKLMEFLNVPKVYYIHGTKYNHLCDAQKAAEKYKIDMVKMGYKYCTIPDIKTEYVLDQA